MKQMKPAEFLTNRDVTGREIIFYPETGKSYSVEYLGGWSDWGDIDPATKKVTGSYGTKYKGSIEEKESIITKENGFDEIVEGKGSPYYNANLLHEKWKRENGFYD